ncbi:hypothetical protein I312_101400 [Cryptococcus bacillisporus CA1280]|uniref:uncharacterized protein n=1 Tax=Cryptococcus bacillisporus CA1280 TaxID=1296109 RepID=UPI003368FF54
MFGDSASRCGKIADDLSHGTSCHFSSSTGTAYKPLTPTPVKAGSRQNFVQQKMASFKNIVEDAADI